MSENCHCVFENYFIDKKIRGNTSILKFRKKKVNLTEMDPSIIRPICARIHIIITTLSTSFTTLHFLRKSAHLQTDIVFNTASLLLLQHVFVVHLSHEGICKSLTYHFPFVIIETVGHSVIPDHASAEV